MPEPKYEIRKIMGRFYEVEVDEAGEIVRDDEGRPQIRGAAATSMPEAPTAREIRAAEGEETESESRARQAEAAKVAAKKDAAKQAEED